MINIAKYSDLVLYLPANFLSVWIIDKYGLRLCISIGSVIMLIGSVMRFISVSSNLYFWYFGHIVCQLSGAFLKNPVTKLASNWFGDKERAFATSVGIVSQPLGLFISQIMIINIFQTDDKLPINRDRAEGRWKLYISIQAILSCAFVIPSLLFIRNKPRSPPSLVATKPRPNQSFG